MQTRPAIKTPAPRFSSEARKSQIIETVIELAARHSPGQITTQEIADEIGLSQGALFRHFPNKEAIFLASIEWIEDRLLDTLEAAASANADPIGKLHDVFFGHVDFVIRQPGVPRLIFNELQHPAHSAIKSAVWTLLQRYRRLVSALIENSSGTCPMPDAGSATTLFIGTIQGLVMQSMLSDNVSTMRHTAEQVFPLFLRCLKEPA